MTKKYNFYFKLAKERTVLSTNDRLEVVKIKDLGGEESIIAGEIADFISFENELERHLESINFKEGFLRKNIAFVGLKPSSSANSKRNIFDSFENLGFSKIYLIDEQIALLHEIRKEKDCKKVIIVNIDSDRIDCSLISKNKYDLNYSIGSNSTLIKTLRDHDLINNIIFSWIEEFSNNPKCEDCNNIIFIGDQLANSMVKSKFINNLDVKNIGLIEAEKLIIDGMKSIAKKVNTQNGIIQEKVTV